jgi:hypothetical protein
MIGARAVALAHMDFSEASVPPSGKRRNILTVRNLIRSFDHIYVRKGKLRDIREAWCRTSGLGKMLSEMCETQEESV